MKLWVTLFIFFYTLDGVGQTPTYFVFLNNKPDVEKISDSLRTVLMTGHMGNISALAVEKKLVAAGPVVGGGGIFILTLENDSLVWSALNRDPAIRTNRWDIEVLPLKIQTGNICKAIEPFVMVTYSIIRYTNENDALEWIEKFKLTENVLMNISFNTGGVIFLNVSNEDERVKLMDNEKPQSIEYRKNQWIGKGTFCE